MKKKRISELLQTFSKFFVSNLLGTLVDTLVLWVCAHLIFTEARYLISPYVSINIISPVISFEFAVLTNYICAYNLTWKGRLRLKSPGRIILHFLKYNLTSTTIFLVKMAFLLLFQRIFGWDVVICNLIALIFSGSVNFALGEWWLFKKKKQI